MSISFGGRTVPPGVAPGGAGGHGPPSGNFYSFVGSLNRYDKKRSPRRRQSSLGFTCFCSQEDNFSNRNPKISARYARCRVTPFSSIFPLYIARWYKSCPPCNMQAAYVQVVNFVPYRNAQLLFSNVCHSVRLLGERVQVASIQCMLCWIRCTTLQFSSFPSVLNDYISFLCKPTENFRARNDISAQLLS